MACACHGKSGLIVNNVLPMESCWACTKKHLLQAYGAFTEYGYEEENLDFIASQLRLSILHCQYLNKDFAGKIRALSVDVEARKFNEKTSKRFEELLKEVQEEIYKAFPDVKKNYDDFKATLSK